MTGILAEQASRTVKVYATRSSSHGPATSAAAFEGGFGGAWILFIFVAAALAAAVVADVAAAG